MIVAYVGEERGGRIKFAEDKDTLSPQIIRYSERVFPSLKDLRAACIMLEERGFKVCIDFTGYFYETEG